MPRLTGLFSGFLGLVLVIMFISVIIMWFCAPILLYAIYQQLRELNEKLKK